ncbi:MAG: sigma-70 family RNA polymerase sigma factor [Prevotella sp.]
MTIERDYERLYKDNYESLYYYALQIVKDEELCRDIINDSFEIVWREREETPPEKRRAFFYRMVHNRCVDYIRKETARNRYAEFYRRMHVAGIVDTGYDSEEDARKQQIVDEVMEELTPQTRNIVQMCFFDNMRYADVAERLGISLSAVKKHVAKAMLRFRSRWRPDG